MGMGSGETMIFAAGDGTAVLLSAKRWYIFESFSLPLMHLIYLMILMGNRENH